MLAEADARRVVLVRAVEESDLDGVVLPHEEREAAAPRGAAPADALCERARVLAARLSDAHPALARLARVGRPPALVLIALAFVLGLATNVFGAERGLHVLANPLVGLLAWNAVVLVLLALSPLLARRGGGERGKAASGLARRVTAWPVRALQRAIRATEPAATAEPLARSATRYALDWSRVAGPLVAARLRAALHVGAIAVTLGALAGMYARGLVLEYHLRWESTFLDAPAAQRVLDVVLGPAGLLSGADVPAVEALGDEGSSLASTRTLLHLYALTVLLFVVVPRALLALAAGRRARRLAGALPLEVGALYYRRLLSGGRGAGLQVDAFPFSFTLTDTRADALRALLEDVFGGAADVAVHPALPYGTEADDPALAAGARGGRPLVVLFNLAQTPEEELQGRLLRELQARASAGLVALADCSAWRERVGAGPAFPERMAEHARAWDRLAAAAGVRIVHVDLEAPATDALLEAIEAGLSGRAPERPEEVPAT